jgi:hypothetical protein
MSEIEEQLIFLQNKYDVAFAALVEISTNGYQSGAITAEKALNKISDISEKQRKHEAMKEPKIPFNTF